MKHKADGLYYLSPEVLVNAGACEDAVDKWVEKFGSDPVPFTLKVARALYKSNVNRAYSTIDPVEWLVSAMHHARHVSYDDYMDFPIKEPGNPRRIMNLLEKRAKEEGKL